MGCNDSLKMIILIVLTLQEVPCVCVLILYSANRKISEHCQSQRPTNFTEMQTH